MKILINLYLSYIRFFAKLKIKKTKPTVVGIGGSNGKSSLASFVYLVLKNKYKVKTSKGKNSETGIPFNILDIDIKEYTLLNWIKAAFIIPFKLLTDSQKIDVYVAEMGIDSPDPPKNMEYLLRILRPSIAVLTNISIEHSLYFDYLVKEDEDSQRKKNILKLISREEGLLLKSLGGSDRAVVNLDDENIKNLLPLKSKIVTVSKTDKSSDFYIKNVKSSLENFNIEFIFLNEIYEIKTAQPLPNYYATTLVLCIAVCFSLGISIKESIIQLEKNFILPPGRFSIFSGVKGSIVIDSSYNSSLDSASGAIEGLKGISGNRRRVGILGDMRELGSLSRIQHELLAQIILKNLDFASIIGPLMVKYVEPILKKHNFNYTAFGSYKSAKEEILKSIKEDDIILVKGSQNTLFLERAVELLLKDKSDIKKLCRRGRYWDKERNKSVNKLYN